MAFRSREELVGKRFLSVRSAGKLKQNKISEWEWRAGLVRAVTHKDTRNQDISVLVEFDDRDWKRREWIRIYDIFQLFLVEKTLIWAPRPDPDKSRNRILWPALNFKPLVDNIGYNIIRHKPVEFLVDHHLEFPDDSELRVFKDDDGSVHSPAKEDPEVRKAVRNWIEYQDGQSILLTTPSVLVGYRVEVYRAEGTTQWYTAVIQSYNDNTRELSVTDDTVLEEHNEDPALVQMRLIGDGVVDSILKGIDVGITPRRRSCKEKDSNQQHQITSGRYTRNRSQSPSHPPVVQRTSARGKGRLRNTTEATTQETEKEKPAERPCVKNQRDRKRRNEEAQQTELPKVTSNKRIKSQEKVAERPSRTPEKPSALHVSTQPTVVVKAVKSSVDSRVKVPVEEKPTREKLKSKKQQRDQREKEKPVAQSVTPNKAKPSTPTPKVDRIEKPERPSRRTKVEDTVKKPESPVTRAEKSPAPKVEKKTRVAQQQQPQTATPETSKAIEKLPADPPSPLVEKIKKSRVREARLKPEAVKVKSKIKGSKKEVTKPESPKPTKTVKPSEPPTSGNKESGKCTPEVKSEKVKPKQIAVGGNNELPRKENQTDRSVKKKEQDAVVASAPPVTLSKSGSPPVSDTRAQSPASTSSPVKTSRQDDEPTMHFKKMHLLGENFQSKEKANTQDALSAAINVQHSVTDQIAKLSSVKGEKLSWNNNDIAASTMCTGGTSSGAPNSVGSQNSVNSEVVASTEAAERLQEQRPSQPDNGHINVVDDESERSISRTSERSSSRMSDERRPSSSSSASNTRVEEMHRRSRDISHSPASSPLNFDKHVPVQVYRDPELLKKAPDVRHIESLQHVSMAARHARTPVPQTSSYPTVHTPIPTAHHSTLSSHHPLAAHQPRSLMASPIHYNQHLGSLSALGPHLQISHPITAAAASSLDPQSLRGLGSIAQQQQAHLQMQYGLLQQQQLSSLYPMHGNMQTAQLEMLWQQKYPSLPVPPAWMLVQYQDELMRDVNLMRERELALERERREREVALERERERERAERERVERERAERERAERDRKEREKAERERAEKERAERERAERERAERERLDRERKERERAEREHQERLERERVLKESAAAAVNHHFCESLRLASQKGSGVMDLRTEQDPHKRELKLTEREQQEHIERERILKESAAAAVNQHFSESLRLAREKVSDAAAQGTWPPSIQHGIAKHGAPMDLSRTTAMTQQQQQQQQQQSASYTASHSTQQVKDRDHREREQADEKKPLQHHSDPRDKQMSEVERQRREAEQKYCEYFRGLKLRSEMPRDIQQEETRKHLMQEELLKRVQLEEKLHQQHQQHSLKEQLQNPKLRESLMKTYLPTDPKMVYSMYKQYPMKTEVQQAGPNAPPTSSSSTGPSIKQEPNFSLYGYQPFQHTYISQEKLYLHGLKEERKDGSASSDSGESMKSQGHPSKQPAASPNQTAANDRGKMNYASPPPLVRDNLPSKQSSVIVENKAKDVCREPPQHHGSITLGTSGRLTSPKSMGKVPPAAHSHERQDRNLSESHMMSTTSHNLVHASVYHPTMAATAAGMAYNASVRLARTQSPLRVASPQQLSAAVMQPMELQRTAPGHKPPVVPKSGSQEHGSNAANTVSPTPVTSNHSAPTSMSGGYVHSMAQPPVSLPMSTATAYSYSLIQQGLVPNPIYSHSSSINATKVSAEVQPPRTSADVHVPKTGHVPATKIGASITAGTPMVSAAPTIPSQGPAQKRRTQKDPGARKRTKTDVPITNPSSIPMHTIPVTTPQIATNPHPYTTLPNSHVGVSSVATTVVTTATNSATGSNSATSNTQSSGNRSAATGFMDSFRSFVENAVQSAFNQDPELSSARHHPKPRHKTNKPLTSSLPSNSTATPTQTTDTPSQTTAAPTQTTPTTTSTTTVTTTSQPSVFMSIQSQAPVSTVAVTMTITSSAATSTQAPTSTSMSTTTQPSITPYTQTMTQFPRGEYFTLSSVSRPSQSTTPSGASISSTSSIMETINRVANGFIDTDSDTLSAPSPPPSVRSVDATSPHKSGGHTKLGKKAWLQRYSDEDKEKDKRQLDPCSNSDEKKSEGLKDCYVNCSYISPTKEGGSKSPISVLSSVASSHSKDFADDVSTSSASETESQGTDGVFKRRMKPKRRRSTGSTSSSKKAKFSDSDSDRAKKRFLRKGKDGFRESNKPKSNEPSSFSFDKSDRSDSESRSDKWEKKRGRKTRDKDERDSSGSRDNDREQCEDQEEHQEEQEQRDQQDTPHERKAPAENLTRINANPSSALATKPLNKAPLAKLKKTLEPFLQDGPCSDVTPKLMKCRECKMTPNQRSKNVPNIFCRFYAFRRLRYSAKGFLTIAGFSEPADAEPDDIELWMPRTPVLEPAWDVEMAKYVIANVGDKFCELVEQEKEAMSWVSPDTKIAWKRAVQGVREMCDVCETTLFNIHWVCHKCGFVVCIDCYRMRTRRLPSMRHNCSDCSDCNHEGPKWLTCSSNRQAHEPEKLMLTQIIPSDALWVVGRMIHEVRDKWRIKSHCPCGRNKVEGLLTPKNGVSQQLLSAVSQCMSPESKSDKPVMNGVSDDHVYTKGIKRKLASTFGDNASSVPSGGMNGSLGLDNASGQSGLSPLSLLADVASMDESSMDKVDHKKALSKVKEKLNNSSDNDKLLGGKSYSPITEPVSPAPSDGLDGDKKSPSNCSTLRELLTKTAGKIKPGLSPENNKKPKTIHSTLDDIIQQVVERNLPKEEQPSPPITLKHYIPRNGSVQARDNPIQLHTLTETSVLFPDVPHSWLDNGRLLRLHDPQHKGNLKLFQQQWRQGQPVLVSNVNRYLNRDLWHPSAFSKEFGQQENDLVNCVTGVVIIGHEMKQFWDGFQNISVRLTDDNNKPMILKLKDWPPTEDFSELLPSRFHDLMQALPLPEHTHRSGALNLASRLPDFFVKPDLGPKMYNAYGSALYPEEGTTNLHLDVSDAVNVMVYVGVAEDDNEDHRAAGLKVIDDAGCDIMTKRRVREAGETPGALWHIFDALDADKIRDLLNKVGKERGEKIESHHDPIHDQSWYLDYNLRERLKNEYGVVGYSIVQAYGDAVFIPAGAPHQVQNIHSCIKIAEDFVSPEHLTPCFKLTQEFRHLSDTHSNHEDKLQVKNIIYHAVKDAVAVLMDSNPSES